MDIGSNSFVNELINKLSKIKTFNIFGDVSIDGREVGYLPTKNGINVAINLPTIEHEIAHMIEIPKKERLLLPDFGFPELRDLDKISKSSFFVYSARETRVRAIEDIIRDNTRKRSSVFNNCTWKEAIKDHLPFGRFTTTLQVVDWAENIFSTTLRVWSKDKIVFEWENRSNYLNNWMES